MAVRTAAAGDLDTTVATLKTQLSTYIGLQQADGNDAPAVLFWQWLVSQLQGVDSSMAQAIQTANMYDYSTVDKTLSQLDGYA